MNSSKLIYNDPLQKAQQPHYRVVAHKQQSVILKDLSTFLISKFLLQFILENRTGVSGSKIAIWFSIIAGTVLIVICTLMKVFKLNLFLISLILDIVEFIGPSNSAKYHAY